MTITIDWPLGTTPAVIAGQYQRRPDGTIAAWYTDRAELAMTMAMVLPDRHSQLAAMIAAAAPGWAGVPPRWWRYPEEVGA